MGRMFLSHHKFSTILADPPWRFQNRTGKVAPEHKRLLRYRTLNIEEIKALPVQNVATPSAHLYLWIPNALLSFGLEVMESWGFTYKTNLVWFKTRKDGGPDGRGVGFYFRNVTEIVLFGVRGSLRTLAPGRRQVNLLTSLKREHSRKPDELYEIIERCSPGPYLELFARHRRDGWVSFGDELDFNEAQQEQLILCPRGHHLGNQEPQEAFLLNQTSFIFYHRFGEDSPIDDDEKPPIER